MLDAWTFCTQAICSQVVAFANGQRHDCDLDGELIPSVDDERLAELLFRCINSTSTLASGSPTTCLQFRVPSAPSEEAFLMALTSRSFIASRDYQVREMEPSSLSKDVPLSYHICEDKRYCTQLVELLRLTYEAFFFSTAMVTFRSQSN